MDKLQFLIFIFAVLLPDLYGVLLCNYRIYLSSLSMLNTVAFCHIRLSKIKTLTLHQVLASPCQILSKNCRTFAEIL